MHVIFTAKMVVRSIISNISASNIKGSKKHRILKVQNTLKIRMLDFEEILSIYGALTVLTSTIQVKQ